MNMKNIIEFVTVTHAEKIRSNLHFQNMICKLISFQSIISATAEIVGSEFSGFPWCEWSMLNSWRDNIYWLYRRRLTTNAGLIIGLRPANEIWRYFVTTLLIDWHSFTPHHPLLVRPLSSGWSLPLYTVICEIVNAITPMRMLNSITNRQCKRISQPFFVGESLSLITDT